MVAIALPLLSVSPFISNFDAFSPKDTCCFNQEQSAIKTRLIKEMSLRIFLIIRNKQEENSTLAFLMLFACNRSLDNITADLRR